MLSENIKKFRVQNNMTQEKLAINMYVVRQTISKWEKGLSVPDADQLISLSKILGVSVNELLDITEKKSIAYEDIAKELEKANLEIAQLSKQYRLEKDSMKVRGLILFLVISSIIISITLDSKLISTMAFAVVSFGSLVILYRNIELLTIVTKLEEKPSKDLESEKEKEKEKSNKEESKKEKSDDRNQSEKKADSKTEQTKFGKAINPKTGVTSIAPLLGVIAGAATLLKKKFD